MWFVDGKDYFEHLYNKLIEAKESIWIAGWMISPEIVLKRPVTMKHFKEGKNEKGENVRLMDILDFKVSSIVNFYTK